MDRNIKPAGNTMQDTFP